MERKELKVVYHHHSGFSVQCGKILLIFDYWTGEHGELNENGRITPDYLRAFEKVYVFVSHDHPDHFDEVIYTWRNEFPDITYIISDDMAKNLEGDRMCPLQTRTYDDIIVHAFFSTDLGVSYLVEVDGLNVFHAGDLNLWHWRQESSLRQIQAAQQAFYQALEPIRKYKLDVAMFPVDPRQGMMYDAGANHFVLSLKPRVMIPMHWQGRVEIAEDFARRSRTPVTEVLALTNPGTTAAMVFENNMIDITIYDGPVTRQREEYIHEDTRFDGSDPFYDTDLPVNLDE